MEEAYGERGTYMDTTMYDKEEIDGGDLFGGFYSGNLFGGDLTININ
jgi:hypothetical protein